MNLPICAECKHYKQENHGYFMSTGWCARDVEQYRSIITGERTDTCTYKFAVVEREKSSKFLFFFPSGYCGKEGVYFKRKPL